MDFKNSFAIESMAKEAEKKFNELQKRLDETQRRISDCMNGKTRTGLIFALLFSGLWAVVTCIFHGYLVGKAEGFLVIISFAITLALIVILIIDYIMNLKYYGSILVYQNQLTQLRNRLSEGKSNIKTNKTTFLKEEANGWKFSIHTGTSIPEEAKNIDKALAGVETFNNGFVSGLKNFLYYAATLSVTIIGSSYLFEAASGIIDGLSDGAVSSGTIEVLCGIGVIITCIGMIILAKAVWGATGCKVTNTTLLIIPAGPILFIALVGVATLLVLLVVLLVKLLIGLAALALAAACVCGSLGG